MNRPGFETFGGSTHRSLQHLVLVRHGESEGDVRRAAFKRGEPYQSTKHPKDEGITPRGIEECHRTGLWIKEHIIQAYGLARFEGSYVSPAIRTEQSAVALELPIAVWQENHSLDARDRGLVAGIRKAEHQELYPDSFAQMRRDPLHWTPPGGEAIVPGVTGRVRDFMDDIAGMETVLAVTHRDWIWAASIVLGFVLDTDMINNGQVIHLTSFSPETGGQVAGTSWVRSVDAANEMGASEWFTIPHDLAELGPLAA